MSPPNPEKHVAFAAGDPDDPENMHERTALFKKTGQPPEDKNNMAYYIFFLLGIGSLLPWNAFITASAYYRGRFCGTDFYWNFEAWFSVAYSLSSEVSLVFVVLQRFTAVLYPLYIFAAIFVVTTALVLFPGIDGNDFFKVTMASIVCVGIVASMVRSGIFTLAGYFPPRYTQAIMGGIGMGGVIVSVLCIITTAGSSSEAVPLAEGGCSTEQPINWSAFMYFSLSSVVLLSNVVGYLVLKKLPITQYYESHHGAGFARPVLLADSVTISTGDVMSLRMTEVDALNADEQPEENALAAASRVLKIVKLPGFSIFFVFLVTYSLYPGLTTLITSEGASAKFFAPAMFLLFNLGDLSGRLSCGSLDVHSGGLKLAKEVASGTLLRVIFVPAFMLCNVAGTVLPIVFRHDAWPFLFMALFSYTSGLLATMSMMIAPTLVQFEDKSMVGAIMTFLLSTGLLAGSCASFLSVRIATGSF